MSESAGINNQVLQLIRDQQVCWDVAQINYAALEKVRTRILEVNGYLVALQFNPERIRSSAAKVDKESLRARPCFLCQTNRPCQQKWIDFGGEYQLIVNPYPIFREHLTIPVHAHQEQRIRARYCDMLSLAKALTDFVVFYNGPKCGASAPDHMHFQAGNKGFLPIEKNWIQAKKEVVALLGQTTLYVLKDFLQPMFILVSGNKEEAVRFFNRLYALQEVHPDEYEPMMNLLAWYEEDKWITCIYPRKKLHPSCYYAIGDANILISPATVEMAGIFVTPLEKDFLKITAGDIQQILDEVCLSEEEMNKLISKFKSDSL